MADAEKTSAGPMGNEATIAAMAEILAAIGNGGGIIEWADEEPVRSPIAGEPVAATGVTIGHGPIRLRDSAPPAYLEVAADLTP